MRNIEVSYSHIKACIIDFHDAFHVVQFSVLDDCIHCVLRTLATRSPVGRKLFI